MAGQPWILKIWPPWQSHITVDLKLNLGAYPLLPQNLYYYHKLFWRLFLHLTSPLILAILQLPAYVLPSLSLLLAPCQKLSPNPTRSAAIAKGPRDASCQLKSCQLPRNSAETTCMTSPEQIKVTKLEGYSGWCVVNMCTQPWCNRVASIVL